MNIVTNNSIRSNYLSRGNYPQGKYAHTCDAFLNGCQGDQYRFQASTKSWSPDLGLLEYQYCCPVGISIELKIFDGAEGSWDSTMEEDGFGSIDELKMKGGKYECG